MRLALLLALTGAVCAIAPMFALGANPPRYHNATGSSGVDCPRYSPPVEYRAPLWTFYHYPRGIPRNLYDTKTPGYRYYPYSIYRSDYPRDHYDRNKSQRYPVR